MATQHSNERGSAVSAPGVWHRVTQSRPYLGWLELAAHFGEIQTQLIIGFVYVFVMGPMSVIAALAGRDLLAKRGFAGAESAWRPADSVSQPDVARAKRLF